MIRIQQEVTTHCSCNCEFCPRHVIHWRRTLGHISDEMAELCLCRYEELGEPFKLSISGFGEPLLWHGVYDFIDKVKKLDAHIELNTNATHLTEKAAKRLIDVVDEIQISLNVPNQELYTKLKNSKTYELIEKNLKDFFKLKGSRKPVTDIRFLVFKQNEEHIGKGLRLWGQIIPKGDAIRIAEFENWMGLINSEHFGVVYPERPPNLTLVCSDLFGTHLTITKEGNAFACCFAVALPEDHPFKLGNIQNQKIKKLLDSPKRKELYEFHRNRKYLDECGKCSKLRVTLGSARYTRYLTPDWFYEDKENVC